jgi:hypothetical protein
MRCLNQRETHLLVESRANCFSRMGEVLTILPLALAAAATT